MTNFRKPLIAITTVQTSVISVKKTYVDLVADLGGIPVLVTQNADVMDRVDGLLIIGGQDVDPAFWHAKQEVSYIDTPGVGRRFSRPLDYAPNTKRDQFELAVYKRAKERGLPVLGICRGLQLINVAEGGSLHQELPESQVQHEADSDGWTHFHNVRIARDSRTYEVMGVESYVTSSRHHQGIDRLGHGLKATAWADDNLIEMIEWEGDDHWVVAVQGHLEQTRSNWPLYDRLVAAFMERAQAVLRNC